MTYPSNSDGVAQDQIQSFFERWDRLEEEKTAISDDLKELFAEAKGYGFDTKVMRAVFRDKGKDQAERSEFEAIYDLYWSALGTPIANARDAREADPEHDAETGEIIEPAQPDPSGVAAVGGEGVDATLAANQSTAARKDVARVDTPDEMPASKQGESIATPVSERRQASVAGTQAPPVDTKPIRPFCLKPSNCGGQGRVHCYSCSKAHADEVGEAA